MTTDESEERLLRAAMKSSPRPCPGAIHTCLVPEVDAWGAGERRGKALGV